MQNSRTHVRTPSPSSPDSKYPPPPPLKIYIIVFIFALVVVVAVDFTSSDKLANGQSTVNHAAVEAIVSDKESAAVATGSRTRDLTPDEGRRAGARTTGITKSSASKESKDHWRVEDWWSLFLQSFSLSAVGRGFVPLICRVMLLCVMRSAVLLYAC